MTRMSLGLRGAAVAAVLLSFALILTGCSSDTDTGDAAPSSSQTRSFEADNGTIEIPTDPQRIVALGSARTYLSLGIEPVGMGPKATDDEMSWFSPEAQQVNAAATDLGQEIDYEQVASLQPDLIILYTPAHVWESGKYNVERLQSIAPTIFIEVNTKKWKTQVERLADAVGALDRLNADKAPYEELAAEIEDQYAADETTFMVFNRWGTEEPGELSMEYFDGYCVNHLEDAGLKVVADDPGADALTLRVSLEQLSDTVADVDVIVYPLGSDGKVKPEFAEIVESNIWQSLPQVKQGRALGVKCNADLTYVSKIVSLESLEEALGTLPEH